MVVSRFWKCCAILSSGTVIERSGVVGNLAAGAGIRGGVVVGRTAKVGVGSRRVGDELSEVGVRGDSGRGLVLGISGGGGFRLYGLCLSVSWVGSNCSRNCVL